MQILEQTSSNFDFPEDVDLEQLDAYVRLYQALALVKREIWSITTQTKHIIPFLQVGRVIKVRIFDSIYYILHFQYFNRKTSNARTV